MSGGTPARLDPPGKEWKFKSSDLPSGRTGTVDRAGRRGGPPPRLGKLLFRRDGAEVLGGDLVQSFSDGTPTDELPVLLCIGVVDVDLDALETGVVDQPANGTGWFR
jgi:hypothetical protein